MTVSITWARSVLPARCLHYKIPFFLVEIFGGYVNTMFPIVPHLLMLVIHWGLLLDKLQNGNFLVSFSCVYSLHSIVSKSFTFSPFISMWNNRVTVHSMGYYLWLPFKKSKVMGFGWKWLGLPGILSFCNFLTPWKQAEKPRASNSLLWPLFARHLQMFCKPLNPSINSLPVCTPRIVSIFLTKPSLRQPFTPAIEWPFCTSHHSLQKHLHLQMFLYLSSFSFINYFMAEVTTQILLSLFLAYNSREGNCTPL